jgi:hypothetical protein
MPTDEITIALARCFSVADLARRWKVGPKRIRADIRKGLIPAFNVGRGSTDLRIAPETVAEMERRLAVKQVQKPARRRRNDGISESVLQLLDG